MRNGFLEFLQLDKLVQHVTFVVHRGMGHAECVSACHNIAGSIGLLCDAACT
ncbi:hypothetical protein ACJMK2_017105, partial [Sinanodonta woodiana]